jgi:hypothetical protein
MKLTSFILKRGWDYILFGNKMVMTNPQEPPRMVDIESIKPDDRLPRDSDPVVSWKHDVEPMMPEVKPAKIENPFELFA